MAEEIPATRCEFIGQVATGLVAADMLLERSAHRTVHNQPRLTEGAAPVKQITAGILDIGYRTSSVTAAG
jgi:hypothetical protein